MTTTSDKRIKSAVNALNKLTVEDLQDGSVIISIATLRSSLQALLQSRASKPEIAAQAPKQHEVAVGLELHPKEIEMLRLNQKIHAIKSVRERTGLCLSDAKTLVEREAARLQIAPEQPY
jgi:ribosomal protein L7/L12